MEAQDSSVHRKALSINLDDSIYGTFAEIGAGQEVARHFFQAGKASHTIAKTISAYDMAFSDAIYGKDGRYVCESRLKRMLGHEYDLLIERLSPQRGAKTRFFAFADTVATSSQHDEDSPKRSHGWMGIRFQSKAQSEPNDIILHVRLWDRSRLQQQEALGILGVNLIHAAFNQWQNPEQIIHSLLHSLNTERIEVDMIQMSGPEFTQVDHRQLALALVETQLTDAIILSPQGQVVHVSDILFKKPVLVQRGTFRPVTNVNMQILERGIRQFRQDPLALGQDPAILFEMTMHPAEQSSAAYNRQDLIARAETLGATGHNVLISKFHLYYQLKHYLRESTDQLIVMVVGASHLEKMFDPKYYQALAGKMLEGFGRLFDDKTRIYVYPYKDQHICQMAQTFNPAPEYQFLYRHLLTNQFVRDIAGCEDVDTSIHSKDVRNMLASGESKWEKLVPKQAGELIKRKRLFGLNQM